MQGLVLTSTSLTWFPFLTVDDCDESGRQCKKNYGALMDIFDLVKNRLNCSVLSYKDKNDDWGTYPKSGAHDYTGEWGGVMGDVSYYATLTCYVVIFLVPRL